MLQEVKYCERLFLFVIHKANNSEAIRNSLHMHALKLCPNVTTILIKLIMIIKSASRFQNENFRNIF